MRIGRLALAALLLAAARPLGAQAGDAPGMGGAAPEPAPSAALLFDLRPLANGLGSGGWGAAAGGELALGGRFSIVAELQFMDLADGGSALLTLHAGPRAYARKRALGGIYFGAYALGGLGFLPEGASAVFGLMLEAGCAWLPRFLPGLIVEPYLKYPWFFGEEILFGVAPGLSLGWAF